jgi:hypothetical protein
MKAALGGLARRRQVRFLRHQAIMDPRHEGEDDVQEIKRIASLLRP